MLKRTIVALCLALSVAAGLRADEADLLGVWAVDTAALRSQMERLIERRLGQLPENQRRPAMARARAQIGSMIGQMAGRAEFKPDGTVVFTSATDPVSFGSWSLENGTLRFGRDQPVPGEPAYVGAIDGDVIEVRPEGEPTDAPFTLRLRRAE